MSGRLRADEAICLDADEAAVLWAAASRLAGERPAATGERVEAAASLITSLPPSVVVALYRFRTAGTEHNALLLRGICADLSNLPDTPDRVMPTVSSPVVEAAALVSLALALLLGEPFTFQSLHDGELVQHINPVKGHESAQTSAGSASTLEWHVEDSFSENRCDYLGLLCLRGHPDAVTFLGPARCLNLPENVVETLQESRYVIAPDVAHGLADHNDLPLVPVLTGPDDDPEICFDAIYLRPADAADERAAGALQALIDELHSVRVGHVLQPGDLLFVDNRRTVHGRTYFLPRYDGSDRWLLRTMTCASIRTHRRRGAVRTLAAV